MIIENNLHNHLKALFYLMMSECDDYEQMKESAANFIEPETETYGIFLKLLLTFYGYGPPSTTEVNQVLELLLTGVGNSATMH